MGIVILIAIGIGIIPLCKGIKHLFEEFLEYQRDSMDVDKYVQEQMGKYGLTSQFTKDKKDDK